MSNKYQEREFKYLKLLPSKIIYKLNGKTEYEKALTQLTGQDKMTDNWTTQNVQQFCPQSALLELVQHNIAAKINQVPCYALTCKTAQKESNTRNLASISEWQCITETTGNIYIEREEGSKRTTKYLQVGRTQSHAFI